MRPKSVANCAELFCREIDDSMLARRMELNSGIRSALFYIPRARMDSGRSSGSQSDSAAIMQQYAEVHHIWAAISWLLTFHCNWYPDVGLSSAKSVASLLVLVRVVTQMGWWNGAHPNQAGRFKVSFSCSARWEDNLIGWARKWHFESEAFCGVDLIYKRFWAGN